MRTNWIIVLLWVVMAVQQAGAQALVPFVQPGAALFAPQISIVNSGTLHDVHATVSADRKYVTLTARPQLSAVIKFETFQVQGVNGGFVGGNPNPAPPVPGQPVNPPVNPPAPQAQPRVVQPVAPGVLAQPGMTKMGSI